MSSKTIDACGLICPLPVLKAQKALREMKSGESLDITTTDARAPDEFALFCREYGHKLESCRKEKDRWKITILRG